MWDMSPNVTMAREAPNPESRIEIGKRLKLLRDALDKTQLQMAHLAGLTTPNAWTNYENGSRRTA
jgi:DNA-binding XRE family transcriptional regulator